MIRTVGLVKEYGNFTAVNDLNLNIKPGEIYGFLGPNGAGKTSTIKMLLGINEPTSGEIYLMGQRYTSKNVKMREKICVVPEKHAIGVWSWMTAFEYLDFFGNLYGVKNRKERILSLMKMVDLHRFRNKPYKGFSRGMLQKLNIIRALLPDPDILFLDEPISGLDPIGVKLIRDMIVSENREGRSIFISSHLLSEVEKICDRIGIIFRGKLIAEDSMDRLLGKLIDKNDIYIEIPEAPAILVQQIEQLDFVDKCVKEEDTFTITVPLDKDYRLNLSEFVYKKGFIPIRIEEKSVSLEDAFMQITNKSVEKLAGVGGKDA